MGVKNLFLHLSLLLIILSASVAHAQIQTVEEEPESLLKKIYLGTGFGYSFLNTDISGVTPTVNFDNDFGSRILLGLDVNKQFSLELSFSDFGTATLNTGGEVDYESFAVNAHLYLFSKDKIGRIGYSGIFKVGLEKIDTSTTVIAVQKTSRQFTLGMGGEYGWANGFAVQVSAQTSYEEVNMLSINLLYRFGHKPQKQVVVVKEVFDGDSDGVLDNQDRCPDTPPQRTVDNIGCEFDEDNDGVADGGDECPSTPIGVLVNRNGCISDTDKDGVENDSDQCRSTPPGVRVDLRGCAMDSDNDGVEDNSDQCPETPFGEPVGTNGCTIDGDGDGDGVLDSADQCSDTIQGAKVNKKGCAIFESQIDGVNFKPGSSGLSIATRLKLDIAVEALLKFPAVRVEIQAHTDSQGSQVYNKALSDIRANSVADYLESKGINRDRMEAVGYGETRPLDGNQTSEGRAHNRRVEFRVLDKGE